jgi:hypothetical protein
VAHEGKERSIQVSRLFCPRSNFHTHTVRAEIFESPSADKGIRILYGGDHTNDASCDDPLCAGSRPADVRARLERAVQRRTVSRGARRLDGGDFRVGFTGSLVVPLANHDAFRRDHNGPYQRIRTRTTPATLRQLERPRHEVDVGEHK